jgi:hypothetical protein
MSFHRYFTIEASFECAPVAARAAKAARSRARLGDTPDLDEAARQFIAKVGKPRFGSFVVRESKYTTVRPGLQLIRQLIREQAAPRRGAAPRGKVTPRRRSRRRPRP